MLQQHGLSPGLALGLQHWPVAGVLGQSHPWTREHRVRWNKILLEWSSAGERGILTGITERFFSQRKISGEWSEERIVLLRPRMGNNERRSLTVFQHSYFWRERREVGMLEGLSSGEPLLGLEQEEWREETNPVRIQPRGLHHQRLGRVGRELVAGQLLRPRDPRPVVLGGGPQHLEDQVELVLHGGAREERPAGGHLVENAAHSPHINGGGVLGGAQQDVRGAVPERHHLIAVGLGRNGLGPGQTKVSQLKEINCLLVPVWSWQQGLFSCTSYSTTRLVSRVVNRVVPDNVPKYKILIELLLATQNNSSFVCKMKKNWDALISENWFQSLKREAGDRIVQ